MRSRTRLLDGGTMLCLGLLVTFCFDRNDQAPPTSDLCAFLEEIVDGPNAGSFKARRSDSDGSINLQDVIRNRYQRCPNRQPK